MNISLEWVRLYVDDYPMTMIDFVDWISSKQGEAVRRFVFGSFPLSSACLFLGEKCLHCMYF